MTKWRPVLCSAAVVTGGRTGDIIKEILFSKTQ